MCSPLVRRRRRSINAIDRVCVFRIRSSKCLCNSCHGKSFCWTVVCIKGLVLMVWLSMHYPPLLFILSWTTVRILCSSTWLRHDSYCTIFNVFLLCELLFFCRICSLFVEHVVELVTGISFRQPIHHLLLDLGDSPSINSVTL